MAEVGEFVADVSIIVPTLNEAAEIANCLRAAWRSGPREIIVVDGGSNDDTLVQASDLAAQIIRTRPGRAWQQNAGAAAAVGDILLFLHADCRLHPDCLAQIAALKQDGGSERLCGAFRQRIADASPIFRWIERGNGLRARLGIPYGDQGIFVARRLFEAAGGFADMLLMEDVDLMWRLRRHTRPQLLEGPLQVSSRRWRKHGVVRQTLRNWCLVSAWSAGISSQRLARYYQPHIDH